eukprot:7049356-Pyramimonas_sp.AAC.1
MCVYGAGVPSVGCSKGCWWGVTPGGLGGPAQQECGAGVPGVGRAGGGAGQHRRRPPALQVRAQGKLERTRPRPKAETLRPQ